MTNDGSPERSRAERESPMSPAENLAISSRIPNEVYGAGRLDVIDELFADDYVESFPLPPGWPQGREAVKQFVVMVRAAFTDYHYTLERQLGQGDLVALHL